jgi:hypothetical protein
MSVAFFPGTFVTAKGIMRPVRKHDRLSSGKVTAGCQ